ncbi:MAG: hypothetical protein LT102_13580 [Burkholderiaceae bacterium]|nr:hypothetical protein [Burkholderiaceae bacterium]
MARTTAAWLGTLVVLGSFTASQAAHAKLDTATDRRYSGVYSNACTDPVALRVRFFEDTMAVERAGRSVVANKVRMQKASRAGATPDFQGLVVGEVRGGDGLAFALHHNPEGLFATIEGGTKSLAALGPGVQGQRLRHCDPNRNALPGAAPAQATQSPPDLLRDAQFRAAYSKALGPLSRERWLERMDGPAPPLRKLTIGGVEYTVAAVCKPHDCAEHNMVVLYEPRQGSVYGLVQQRGGKRMLGSPPGTVAAEIEKLWTTEWRGGR